MNTGKKTVGFICIHNSCRSQMAEGWAEKLGGDVMDAYSAGTEKYGSIKPLAVEVMKEADADIEGKRPKLYNEIPGRLDILITMGCGAACPLISAKYREDWAIEDPSGKDISEFRKTRDIIRGKVMTLIDRIKKGEYE